MSEADEDQKALKRIMAFLLSLADVAERASRRSLPLRLLLLWLLRPAEAYARDLIRRAAYDLGYRIDFPPSDIEAFSQARRGGPTEALRLALAFERLAALVDDLAALVLARGGSGAPIDRGKFLLLLKTGFTALAPRSIAASRPAFAVPVCHDTS